MALPVAPVLDLWARGFNTADIASLLGTREHEVYNLLARLDGPFQNRASGFSDANPSPPSGGLRADPLIHGVLSPTVAGTEKSTDEKLKSAQLVPKSTST